MSLSCDNQDYEVLKEAAQQVKYLGGISCEIGVRAGGSSKIIVDELLTGSEKVFHVAVDPYGQIPHHSNDVWVHHTDSYNNRMKMEFLRDFATYALEKDFDFSFFALEDWEFMKRFSDGVPLYNVSKLLCNTYRLVFLDGPHDTRHVEFEIEFFADRLFPGGIIVIDNIMNHDYRNSIKVMTSKGFKEWKRNASNTQAAFMKLTHNPQDRYKK